MWFQKKTVVNKQHTASCIEAAIGAFPRSLCDDVLQALNALDSSSHEPHIHDGLSRFVNDQTLMLPSRVYFSGVREHKVKSLTPKQRQILAALMTRHHSGYQRESWGRALCEYPSSWATPFLVELLGDYVFEILLMLERNSGDGWKPFVAEYTLQNHNIRAPLNHRILNYWNAYYRWYPPNIRELKKYPGYIAAERLGLWEKGVAKKLLWREG